MVEGGKIGESCVLGFFDVANNHESTVKTARNGSREQAVYELQQSTMERVEG